MISILMPVYNTNSYDLHNSIDSCLEQTFKNFEIIIVNNSSNLDETIKTLDHYSANNKIKIFNCERHFDEKNISNALNCGLEKCSYDLVARMDSDDIMLPERLEKQYAYMLENSNVDILGTQIIINNLNITNHPLVITNKIAANSTWFLNHPTVLYKKQKIIDIGGYKNKPSYIVEDLELWFRCLTNGLVIHNLPEVLLKYNFNNNNETKKTEKMNNYHDYFNQIIKNFRDNNDIS